MNKPRYSMTTPIRGHIQYFDIHDREDEAAPNFSVVTVAAHLPHALRITTGILKELNKVVRVPRAGGAR